MSTRHTTAVLSLFLLAVMASISIFVWSAWDRSFMNHDGVQYVSTAVNFFEGRGFATGSLLYDGHYQSVLPAPQSVWPPGFPLLISTLLPAGITPVHAALLIELLAHCGAALCVLVILLRAGISSRFSLLAASAFLLFAQPWKYVTQLLADPVMGFLMLLILAVMPNAGTGASSKGVWWKWLLCALLCALLLNTRYSAILFVTAFCCVALFTTGFIPVFQRGRMTRERFLNSFWQLLLLGTIPVVAFAMLMYRNYSLTGNFLPNNGSDTPLSIVQTIKKFLDGATGFLGIDNSVLPGLINSGLSVVIVLLIVGLLFYSALILKQAASTVETGTAPGIRRYFWAVIAVVVVHTLLFTAYFVYKSLTPGFPELVPRYIFQIFGGVYVLFCLVAGGALQSANAGPAKALLFLLLVLFVAIQVGQINTLVPFNRHEGRHQMIAGVLASEVSDGRSVEALIQDCYSDDPIGHALWSNEGQLLHHYTGVSTLVLPAKGRFAEDYNQETIAGLVDTYNVKLLAILESRFRKDNIQPLDTLRGWFTGLGYQAMPIDLSEAGLGQDTRAEVYVVDPQCL